MKDFFKDFKKRNAFFFFLSCLIPFLVYLKTLCPTVYPGDGGELIAAAYTLGIPHPPGYPLYCLLGKLFTFLPFGNIAYRLNLLSATFASLTVGFVYLIIMHLLRKKDGQPLAAHPTFAFAGALFSGFLRDFWFQALSAEVYTLHTFFFALLLYLILRWLDERKGKILFLSFFLFGLGLGNHHTLLVFAPLFLLMVLFEAPHLLKDFRFLGKACFFLALGLSVYLYLPLRAMSDPPMNWGMSPTFGRTLYHILRLQYTGIDPVPRSLALYAQEIHSFLQTWGRQGPILFWLFSVLGFWRLLSKYPREWLVTTFLFLETTLFLIMVVHFEVSSKNVILMRPFYLPAWMMLSLFWGLGVSEILTFFYKKFPWAKHVLIGGMIFPLIILFKNFPSNDLSHHHLAEDFGRDMLDTVPRDGILFISGDDAHFILAYLKVVEHLRPDLSIIALEQPSPFPAFPKKNFFKFMSRFENPSVYTNVRYHPHFSYPAGFELKTNGILYQLVRKGKEVSKTPWDAYRVKDPEGVSVNDVFEKFVLTRYLWMKGESFLEQGNREEARKIFESISTVADEEGFLHALLGSYFLKIGWVQEGYGAFQEAYRHNPYDPDAWKGLGMTFGRLGHYHESIQYLLRALERRPHDPDITFSLGLSYGKLKDSEKTLFWWRKTLLLDPSRHGVREFIQKAKVPSY